MCLFRSILMFFGVLASLATMSATSSSALTYEERLFFTEIEFEKLCKRIDGLTASSGKFFIIKEDLRKLGRLNIDQTSDEIFQIAGDLRVKGVITVDELRMLTGSALPDHPDSRVQAINEIHARRDEFGDVIRESLKQANLLEAQTIDDIGKVSRKKVKVAQELKELRKNRPSPYIFADPEEEKEVKKKFDEQDESIRRLNEILQKLEKSPIILKRNLERLRETHAENIEYLKSKSVSYAETQASENADDEFVRALQEAGGVPVIDDDFMQPQSDFAVALKYPPTAKIRARLGKALEPDLEFQNFGQRLNTNDSWFVSAELVLPGLIGDRGSALNQWQFAPTFTYLHVEMDQFTHTNIAGGAIGPSAGSVRFDYVGAGLTFEREFPNAGTVGLGAGIGALFHDVSGSFRASGTTAALKFDAYSLFDVSPRVSMGPVISVIFPLDDVSGGAGAANSRFETDPVFLFGLQLDFGLRRPKFDNAWVR